MKVSMATKIARKASALSAAAMLAAPNLAHAGLPDVAGKLADLSTWLVGCGVALFTLAIMWTGYRMAFSGAQFRDCSNIVWGGVLAGGAATFAGWLFA